MYYGQIPKANTTCDVPQKGFWSVMPELPFGFLELFHMPKPPFWPKINFLSGNTAYDSNSQRGQVHKSAYQAHYP